LQKIFVRVFNPKNGLVVLWITIVAIGERYVVVAIMARIVIGTILPDGIAANRTYIRFLVSDFVFENVIIYNSLKLKKIVF
jgi:hypothetical protein